MISTRVYEQRAPSQLFRQREYEPDIALPLMSGCMVLRTIIERREVNQDMNDIAIKRKKKQGRTDNLRDRSNNHPSRYRHIGDIQTKRLWTKSSFTSAVLFCFAITYHRTL